MNPQALRRQNLLRILRSQIAILLKYLKTTCVLKAIDEYERYIEGIKTELFRHSLLEHMTTNYEYPCGESGGLCYNMVRDKKI